MLANALCCKEEEEEEVVDLTLEIKWQHGAVASSTDYGDQSVGIAARILIPIMTYKSWTPLWTAVSCDHPSRSQLGGDKWWGVWCVNLQL